VTNKNLTKTKLKTTLMQLCNTMQPNTLQNITVHIKGCHSAVQCTAYLEQSIKMKYVNMK